MNVILIISDTFRRDNLSCYGGDLAHTPSLDRFASEAILFENAYCLSFPTVPNRNDILTGRATFTYKPWSPLDPKEITLQDTLNKAGVLTSLIVDTPHPFAPGFNYQRGFQGWELIRGQEHDRWKTAPSDVKLPCDPNKLRNPYGTVIQYLKNVSWRKHESDYFVARTMRTAIEWLEENYASRFFLYVDTFDPHEPWDPPKHYVDMFDPDYDGEEVIYPRYDRWREFLSEKELQHCRALYAAEATMVDRWIGLLLERIESLGLMKNTVVIFTTDHGFYLGEHGYIGKSLIRENYHQSIPLYPEVSAIPLIMYVPGMEGKRIKALVQSIDLMPTILDFMEVEIPPTVQGYSLKPLIEGKANKVRDVAIASPTLSSRGIKVPHPTNRATITDGEWMLIYGSQVEKVEGAEMTEMVDSIKRRVAAIEEKPLAPELYYLPEDPGCERNLFEENHDKAKEIHAQFVEFLERCEVPEEHLRFFRYI
ncbi:TPA: sulfatase [Candidatus Poribacteria bacterium]|nr:sulfatase [Candidatus Poribacteria bacterium]HEX28460.1 sulfatase [Candidatus Poribacteria bacterium]